MSLDPAETTDEWLLLQNRFICLVDADLELEYKYY